MHRGRNYFSSTNRGGHRGHHRGHHHNHRDYDENRGHRNYRESENNREQHDDNNRGYRSYREQSENTHREHRDSSSNRGHREYHSYREQSENTPREHRHHHHQQQHHHRERESYRENENTPRERENNQQRGHHHGGNNREYKCLVSAFKINVRPKSIVYNYEVNIVFRLENNASERHLSKKGDRDFCRHILQNVCTFDQDDYVYDGKALLWANKLLSGELSYSLPSTDFDELTAGKLRDVGTLFIGLKLVDQFDLSEFGRYIKGENLIEERRSQRNVCELILSQSALNRGDFTLGGIGQLFDVDEKNFYGLVTREGNSKGVHVIDDDGHPQLVMSLEYSKKIFYPGEVNLLTFYKQLRQEEWRSDDLAKLFSGLKLSLTYNPGRIITFDRFTKVPLEKLTVGEITMVQFYENQWNIKLEHTSAKAVISKNNCGTFPMELLTVVPNQSVPNDRLPEDLQATALEINRLKTNDRHARIMKQFERLGLNLTDSVCKHFGVEVEGKMMSGPFSRLPKTVVLVRAGQQLTVDDYGSFKFERNQYLIPSRIQRLVVLASRKDRDKSMACIQYIKKETLSKGMIIENEIEYQEFNTGSRELDYWVQQFQSLQDAFVIAIDNVGDSHPLLKLAAAITSVETQHVKWDTASLMSNGGRGQTRENIVHQVNVKSGGLNHKVLFDKDIRNLNLDNGNILVIGIDVCHPTGCNFRGETAVPSTVGIVGNYNENPNSFSGTFFFQKSRQENIDSYFLQKSVKKMLAANPRSGQIDTIVILRDGVSEGQYSKVLNDEIQAVKRGASDFFGHPDTSIVCIIVTKNGNARHFDITNRQPTSLPPRSVVTFGCRYNFKQFYLVCHRAFQGTAKAVMCTVLRDDLVCEWIELEKFIMALTNLHQIVCAPISLPEPIYQADKLAQRGHEIFTALKQYSPHSIKYDENDCIKLQELSTNIGFNFGK